MAQAKRTSINAIEIRDALLSVRQGRVMTWTYAATGDASFLKNRDEAFEQYRKQIAPIVSRLITPIGKQLVGDFNESVLAFEETAKHFNRPFPYERPIHPNVMAS